MPRLLINSFILFFIGSLPCDFDCIPYQRKTQPLTITNLLSIVELLLIVKSKSIMDSLIAGLIVVFSIFTTIVGVLALGVIVNGYVLSILWVWFLVPFGLPAISIAHSIGIAMVTSWLTYQHQTSRDEDKDKAFQNLAIIFIVRPLATLGIGYVVKQFM